MQATFNDTERKVRELIKNELNYRFTEFEINKNRYVSLIRNWKHTNKIDKEIEKV